MGRSDCRNCGHKHFNQGVGPCRDCFCTSFRGYARVPRSARSRMPPGSHLGNILASRGLRGPPETDWGW